MGFAFVDSAAHPAAKRYYASRMMEPIGGTSGNNTTFYSFHNVVDIPHMDLSSLIYNIKTEASSGSEILICCHGTEDSLHIPLVPGTRKRLTVSAAQLLGSWGDTLYSGDRKPLAKDLGIPQTDLELMLADLEAIRKKRLSHIAIRACNIGKNLDLLWAICEMFNCASLSAPMLRDAYAEFRPGICTSAEIEEARRLNPTAVVYPQPNDYRPPGTASKRFVLGIFYQGSGTSFDVAGWSEGTEGVDQYLNSKYVHGAKPAPFEKGQSLVVHGMFIYPFLHPVDIEYTQNLKMVQNFKFR